MEQDFQERIKYDIEEHGADYGVTGSGKTYWAREKFYVSPFRAIFINPNEEDFPKCKILEPNDISRTTLTKALRNRKVVLNLGEDNERELGLLFEFIKYLVQDLKNDREVVFDVTVDEAHYFCKHGVSTALSKFIRVASRNHTVMTIIDQRPSTISKTVASQCKQAVLFKIEPAEEEYFRKNVIGGKAILPKRKWDYVIRNTDGDISELRRLKKKKF